MSYGLEILNDSNKIIAGSDIANLCFYGKVTVFVGTGGITIPSIDGSTLNFYKTPLPLLEQAGKLYLASMGSVYQGWWSAVGANNISSGAITCFCFGPIKPNANSMGISVFDENGKDTYNNGSPLLKVVSTVKIATDSYQVVGDDSPMFIYKPVTVATGLTGDLAFALGNTRVYWCSSRLTSGGSFFTDAYRFMRAMHLNASNNFSSSTIETAFWRSAGLGNNFNYSPNGGVPMTLLVVDVTNL